MLTYPQTMLVTKNAYARAIGLEVLRRADFFVKLPMAMVEGGQLIYEREGTEPSVDWIAFGGAAPESGTGFRKCYTEIANMGNTVTEAGPQRRYMWDENQRRRYIAKVVKAQIYEYLNRLWNGSRAVGTLSSAAITGIAVASIGPNCRLGQGLIQLTVVGIVKTLAWQAPGDSNVGAQSADLNLVPAGTAVTLVSEDGTAELRLTVNGPALNVASAEVGVLIQTITNQFEGLRRLLPAAQLCDPTGANGSVLSLDFMRQAEDLNNGPKETLAWCCTRAGLRQFKKIRDAANVTPEEIDIGYGRGVRPAFDSIPFFVCDQLPDNLTKGTGTALTEFWLISFGQPDGSTETAPYTSDGVVGLYSGNSSTEQSVIQSMPDDPTVPMQWMGFWRDEEMGKVSGFDRFEEQVGADVGVALYCQSAISCLRFIRTT